MTFIQSLAHLGITEEFRQLALTGCGNGPLEKWCFAHPQLQHIVTIPTSFQYVREKLNCSAKHGGIRGSGKQSPVSKMIRRGMRSFERSAS